MTTGDLINIFLRLEMAGKDSSSDLVFDAGVDGQSPFAITGVRLDGDGDVCLESNEIMELDDWPVILTTSKIEADRNWLYLYEQAFLK